MRVNTDEIKEAGLRKSWEPPCEQIDEIVSGDRNGFRATGPAHVEARLDKIERRVRISVHANVPLSVPCSRCLNAVALGQPVDFELTLVPEDEYEDAPRDVKDANQGDVAGSFGPEAAEEETYAGKVIDLDPLFREQLILALPTYPVCREDCKGLCPVCGANLNERECGCDRHVPDPRWAGLKDIKL